MNLDWHDLKTNGCPALLRALKTIETILNEQEARHSQAETDIAELQYLLSEELIARLAPRSPQLLPRQRQIVAELGNGWRIERSETPNASAATSDPPAANPAATAISGDWVSDGSLGTPGVSWLRDDWVTHYTAAVDGD